MLKREDNPGISKLVRNSLLEGKAVVRSSSNFGSGCARFAFFFVRKRFIFVLYRLVNLVLRVRLYRGDGCSCPAELRADSICCIVVKAWIGYQENREEDVLGA